MASDQRLDKPMFKLLFTLTFYKTATKIERITEQWNKIKRDAYYSNQLLHTVQRLTHFQQFWDQIYN
jgi:hypothetical protein